MNFDNYPSWSGALMNAEGRKYFPLSVHCNAPKEWEIIVNEDTTVTKPEGMTEGEALLLAVMICSNSPIHDCPVRKAALEKWAPFWGKPATIETEKAK